MALSKPLTQEEPPTRTVDEAQTLLIVGRQQDKKALEASANALKLKLLSASEYLSKPELGIAAKQIINLCAVEDYLSQGYYVSLLAKARGQRAVPNIDTITGLSWKKLYKNHLAELGKLIAGKVPADAPSGPKDAITVECYFGEPNHAWAKRLAARAFRLFPAPILEIKLKHGKAGWAIEYIWPLSSASVDKADNARFCDCLSDYHNNRRNFGLPKRKPSFDIAILVDPQEKMPPSNEQAIRQFMRAAERQNLHAEVIGRKDLNRLSSFDALFIRETTNIDNHTFTFARKAEELGLPVMDDSVSILRCSNKVYLREAMARAKIATPKTFLVTKTTLRDVLGQLPLPMVLKIPDGSFSRGVVKVKSEAEYLAEAAKMLEDSFIVIAQEYLPTDFDWRIGVLDGKPLFACKYHMARGHWQIYNHKAGGKTDAGTFETMPVESAPDAIVKAAVKAAAQMGRGLYGVDLKQVGGQAVVIEVNDNPNIDAGVEDKFLGEKVYDAVMGVFRQRILASKGLAAPAASSEKRA